MKNRLQHSSSPYLRQHADNPVDWYPWGEEALQAAKKDNKPILLSIGYSACHWCHVMAHESFENEALAAVMNERFVNIKLDREERPDIDSIYMDAVQAMGQQGGWPLNVFLTPELEPFYGGTYFPPAQWRQILEQVSLAFMEQAEKVAKNGQLLRDHLGQSDLAKYGLLQAAQPVQRSQLSDSFDQLAKRFDSKHGGMDKAPKFPMPSLWQALLTASQALEKPALRDHTWLTLDHMLHSGLYDTAGGGWTRYSTDAKWFAPHFEKMAYDNGQLLSLYARAYQFTKNADYAQALHDTVEWLHREMSHPTGAFFAALDADSEGVEGKYYTWTHTELQTLLGEDSPLMSYWQVVPEGNWERGRNILFPKSSPSAYAKQMSLSSFEKALEAAKQTLLDQRGHRVRPGTDTKLLTGWNGLLLSGLCHTHQATGSHQAKAMATANTAWLQQQTDAAGRLLRLKDDTQQIGAFLEDYGAAIGGLIDAYRLDWDESLLATAARWTEQALELFWDDEEQFFFFSASPDVLVRKKELFDNVIPSSNAMMARNLDRLGLLMDRPEWREKAATMRQTIAPMLAREVEYLSHWAAQVLEHLQPQAEIVVVGPGAHQAAHQLLSQPLFSAEVMATEAQESSLPHFEGRLPADRLTYYVCYNRACQAPVHTQAEVLTQLQAR